MPFLSLNVRAELDLLIKGMHSGKNTLFDVEAMAKGRLANIVQCAGNLAIQYDRLSIEVKFSSKYNERVKRLEIVGIVNDTITIYKMSGRRRYDKDAIELNRDIEELQTIYPNCVFVGKLVMPSDVDCIYINDKIRQLCSAVDAVTI